MKTRLLLAICLAAACAGPPELLPPPFGPGGTRPARFFFPTGLAVVPSSGALLVANGNSNRAFDGGTVVSVKKSYLDAVFAKQLSCDTPTPPAGCDDDVTTHNSDVFAGYAMIGNYAGPLAYDAETQRAFTGSRDANTLSAVQVNPDDTLQCIGGGQDCRAGILDLSLSGVYGPFSIVPGDVQRAGEATPRRVLYVSSMIPRIESIISGAINSSGVIAALDMANPTQVLFTMEASTPFTPAGATAGSAVGPMVFDAARRQLLMSGCFQRFAGTGAGEPGTGYCSGVSNNWLRILDVDAQNAANVALFDMYGDVLSTNTTAMVLGDADPASGVPTTLWATMRIPDALVQVELPASPSIAPRVRRAIPLSSSPADLVRIPRPGKGDLIAVAAEKSGSVVFYDTDQQQLVAQVERLGDSPFALKVLSNDGVTARLASTVFNSCSIALIEVPLATPWDAALRGRVGKCP